LQRELVGRLSPFRSADVRARVAGVLQKRVYEEGSTVKEGQVLFLIDPAPLQASLASAEGALASARATYVNARATANRARSLAPQSYVSKSDLDSAEAAERSSAAAVQQAEAAVTTARINLGYARVSAPIAGQAGKQQVTEGALVGQGDVTLLTTVDQIDPLYVNFSMTADELSLLRAAQDKGAVALAGDGKTTVQVNLPDGSAYGHEGTLDFSSTTVDPATGTVSLRAQLPNPNHILLPGSFVSFKANLGERHNAFLVPQQAVQRDTQGGYVLIVGKDGKVVRKNVSLDNQQGGNWLVSSGLAAGDKIIVSGVQKVKEGAPATAKPWQPDAAKPAAGAPAAAPAKKE
jgi:membrane fusion protein (multidrug efflux system)